MRYHAVIDTNVLVSALLKWNSIPGRVVQASPAGAISPVVSDVIVEEYEDVLRRRKFRFDSMLVREVLDGLYRRATRRAPVELDEEMPDSNDVVFYAVALSARDEWDTRLVTGNARHFLVRPFVVTPREMLDIIGD